LQACGLIENSKLKRKEEEEKTSLTISSKYTGQLLGSIFGASLSAEALAQVKRRQDTGFCSNIVSYSRDLLSDAIKSGNCSFFSSQNGMWVGDCGAKA
jgi:hypothetical protein